MDGFDAFWSRYPKKRAKGDARKAWAKLKPDAALQQRMADALAWQINQPDWRKDGGQFIPFPATWLRSERWDDQATELPATPHDDWVTRQRDAVAAQIAAARVRDARRAQKLLDIH